LSQELGSGKQKLEFIPTHAPGIPPGVHVWQTLCSMGCLGTVEGKILSQEEVSPRGSEAGPGKESLGTCFHL
jgi:hypothetical protein